MSPETSAAAVLVVDDDADIREIITFALTAHGYPTVAMRDGTDALAWLRRQPHPSLILLDLMMPELGGIGFMASYRADPQLSAIPVVVMSGDREAEPTADAVGARGCLKKPMNLDQLIATVERWAGRREPGVEVESGEGETP